MSSRNFFLRHLAPAKEVAFDTVSNIRRGELEDGFAFTFSHHSLESSVEVEVVVQDVTSYLSHASFMVFTSSDCRGAADIARFLEHLSRRIPGNSAVSDIIMFISNKLVVQIATVIDGADWSSGDTCSQQSGDDEALEVADLSEASEETGTSAGHPATSTEPSTAPAELRDMEAWKGSLQMAQSAGIFIGLLPAKRLQVPRVVSLSVRVAQLGLPDNALEAWDLKANEYLVLLIRLTSGYPSIETYLELPTEQEDVQFRFGKCAAAKPSLNTALIQFHHFSEHSNVGEAENDASRSADDTSFLPNHMSTSVNCLLNQRLHKLLALRRRHRLSWTSALGKLYAMEQGLDLEIMSSDDDDGAIICQHAPAALQRDCAFDQDQHFSIPLVAMQLALRHLARCTEFCMACYGKVDGPDSLKPYVCAKPLCLYQYLSLGFGPAIEHEIINSPYVVDLLVGFFYSAVWTGLLREFPSGLALKAPDTNDSAKGVMAQAQLAANIFQTWPGNDDDLRYSIKCRDWVALFVPRAGSHSTGVDYYVCLITDIQHQTYGFDILSGPFEQPVDANVQISQLLASSGTKLMAGWSGVVVFPFSHDPECLPAKHRNSSLGLILCGIPSVLEMRAYLLKRPGVQLSSWARMSRSSLVLLDWVLASNRSLIVQDQPITSQNEVIWKENPWPISTPGVNPIAGMLQFRFAQGAPDKEHHLNCELEEHTVNGEGVRQQFPTLFAWHGSPLGNWHSIIRTGLDFQTTAHGRAYCNGVYLSSSMLVSDSYSQIQRKSAVETHRPSLPAHWPNSQLVPSAAISLCGVVNRPDMFVSTSPHYVVDRVKWIQCRYLYVTVNPTNMALAEPFPGRKAGGSEGYIAQDPSVELRGLHDEKFRVPMTAIPACRRRGDDLSVSTPAEIPKKSEQPDMASEERDVDDGGDDLDLLVFSDEGTQVQSSRRKRRRMSLAPPVEELALYIQPAGAQGDIDMKASGFYPGSLNLSTLPSLPPPSWATSSPQALHTLCREVKELHRVQSKTATRELGWYVDTEKIDNLFHWIVELHSFDAALPLAQDMKRLGYTSIVLEIRFGASFPLSPPFVRVIRPRFLPFARGGGGHVTVGGTICSELLTNSGWSPALTMEKVLLQVRVGLCEPNPPARLDDSMRDTDYGIGEAAAAYKRAAATHGWQIPADLERIAAMSWD